MEVNVNTACLSAKHISVFSFHVFISSTWYAALHFFCRLLAVMYLFFVQILQGQNLFLHHFIIMSLIIRTL